MEVNLSWPHVTKSHPTPEERAERVLNLMFGKNMWNEFSFHSLVNEFRDAEHGAIDFINRRSINDPKSNT